MADVDPLWPLAFAAAIVLVVVALVSLGRAAAAGDRQLARERQQAGDPPDELAWWRHGVLWADNEED